MATTWLATVHPRAASRLFATAPQATFAAVSRALARSITSRMSSSPYSSAPPRSAWPGRGTITRSAARRARRGRLDRQHVSPVGRVAIGDEERERRPGRPPVAHAAEDAHPVLLDALPVAAAVAALAPAELGVDGRRVDGETGRAAVEHGRQPGPVRLPGGEIAQSAHGPTLSAPRAQAQGEALSPQAWLRGRRWWRTRDGAACGRPVASPHDAVRALLHDHLAGVQRERLVAVQDGHGLGVHVDGQRPRSRPRRC